MRRRARHLLAAVGLLTAVGVVVATAVLMSRSRPDEPMNTITQQEANRRAEGYIRDAVAALRPAPALEDLAHYEASPCDDPSDDGPRGRVFASHAYWLREVPRDRNAEVVQALVDWWTGHDFTVTADRRPGANLVLVQHKVDSFRMSVQESADGDLSIGADSPCVWPDGTP